MSEVRSNEVSFGIRLINLLSSLPKKTVYYSLVFQSLSTQWVPEIMRSKLGIAWLPSPREPTSRWTVLHANPGIKPEALHAGQVIKLPVEENKPSGTPAQNGSATGPIPGATGNSEGSGAYGQLLPRSFHSPYDSDAILCFEVLDYSF